MNHFKNMLIRIGPCNFFKLPIGKMTVMGTQVAVMNFFFTTVEYAYKFGCFWSCKWPGFGFNLNSHWDEKRWQFCLKRNLHSLLAQLNGMWTVVIIDYLIFRFCVMTALMVIFLVHWDQSWMKIIGLIWVVWASLGHGFRRL